MPFADRGDVDQERTGKAIDSRFVTITRSPNVSHGNPFQIEVGLIFGKGMADSVEVLVANRVPLMYQQEVVWLPKPSKKFLGNNMDSSNLEEGLQRVQQQY